MHKYLVKLWESSIGFSADLVDNSGVPHPSDYEFLTGTTAAEIRQKIEERYPGYEVDDLGWVEEE